MLLEKRMIPGLGQENNKRTLKNLFVLKTKEVLKEWGRHSKDTVANDLACANLNIKKLMMTVSDYKSFNKRGNRKYIINLKK